MRKREKTVKRRPNAFAENMTKGGIAGLLAGGMLGSGLFNRKVEFFEFTEAHKLGFLLGSLDVCKECKTKIKKMINNDL